MLSTQWPASAADAHPPLHAATAPTRSAPTRHAAKGFTGADYDGGLEWSTEIHDNVATAPAPHRTSSTTTPRSARGRGYDSNGDGLMWVRAQSFSAGRRRTMVALIRAERLDTLFPRNVITAEPAVGLQQRQQDDGGDERQLPDPALRQRRGGQLPDAACQDWGRAVHVGPNATVDVVPNQRPALSPETIERMREFAKANGTYHDERVPEPRRRDRVPRVRELRLHRQQRMEHGHQAGVLIIGSGTLVPVGETRPTTASSTTSTAPTASGRRSTASC